MELKEKNSESKEKNLESKAKPMESKGKLMAIKEHWIQVFNPRRRKSQRVFEALSFYEHVYLMHV
jgi:hypothetical protein